MRLQNHSAGDVHKELRQRGLGGQLEVRASDGNKRTFTAGDAVLMEDTSGQGHSSRAKGEKDMIAAIVSLE